MQYLAISALIIYAVFYMVLFSSILLGKSVELKPGP